MKRVVVILGLLLFGCTQPSQLRVVVTAPPGCQPDGLDYEVVVSAAALETEARIGSSGIPFEALIRDVVGVREVLLTATARRDGYLVSQTLSTASFAMDATRPMELTLHDLCDDIVQTLDCAEGRHFASPRASPRTDQTDCIIDNPCSTTGEPCQYGTVFGGLGAPELGRLGQGLTVLAHVSPALTEFGTIVARPRSSNDDLNVWRLALLGGRLEFETSDGTDNAATRAPLAPGAPHVLVGAWTPAEGGVRSLYIDGEKVGFDTLQQVDFQGDVDDVHLGTDFNFDGPADGFEGIIHEIRLYDRALSAERVAELSVLIAESGAGP